MVLRRCMPIATPFLEPLVLTLGANVCAQVLPWIEKALNSASNQHGPTKWIEPGYPLVGLPSEVAVIAGTGGHSTIHGKPGPASWRVALEAAATAASKETNAAEVVLEAAAAAATKETKEEAGTLTRLQQQEDAEAAVAVKNRNTELAMGRRQRWRPRDPAEVGGGQMQPN